MFKDLMKIFTKISKTMADKTSNILHLKGYQKFVKLVKVILCSTSENREPLFHLIEVPSDIQRCGPYDDRFTSARSIHNEYKGVTKGSNRLLTLVANFNNKIMHRINQ